MKHSISLTALVGDSHQLSRLVMLASGLLALAVAAFAGYYYWDRYLHPGDQSPLELGVERLEEMVRENPGDPESRLALAQYYFDSGDYQEAIDQAKQINALFPEMDGALFILGISYVRSGETEAAVEPLLQFTEVRGKSPMAAVDKTLEAALYFLGESYVKLGRPEAAIRALTQALEIDYTDADAMYQLGLAHALNGRHELALEQYHQAVRFVPAFAEAYQGMIASYSALQKPAYVAYSQGMEAFSLKHYEAARIHLESASNDLPYFAPAALGLGLTFEQLGDLRTAEAYLKRAVELDSEDFVTGYALARVQLALGEPR